MKTNLFLQLLLVATTKFNVKLSRAVGLLTLLACALVVSAQTTNVFYEDFEDADRARDDWFAESGTWEIGVPTFGPPTNSLGRAFRGTNCAATVLGDNYTEDQSSRLVSRTLVVPPATSKPRLRIWHWYSWGAHDFGVVQVRVGNGVWEELGPRYTATSGGVWTRPCFDLSNYAGKTIQLGFYFESHNNFFGSTVGPGWYIDEVAVVTGLEPFNNPEGWEEGLGDWFTETGTWQVGVPTSGPPPNSLGQRAYSGTNCAATVLTGNYAEDTSSRLVSPPFVVPPTATKPRLRFWHWYSWGAHDFGTVQVRVGTNDWQNLETNAYTGNSGGVWTRPLLDMSPYAGQTVQIAFYFEAHNNFFGSTVGPGWYIDEVRLTHDFAVVLVDSPIVRTHNSACTSLGIASSSPTSNVTFTLRAQGGQLINPLLNIDPCWNGNVTPQSDSQWLVTLQNNCTNASMGVHSIGSLCFTADAAHSAIVPLTIENLEATNQNSSPPPTHAFGSRTVIIANEPLVEARRGTNGQQTVTLYGKPNTSYEIQYTTDLNPGGLWFAGWTNTVPAAMSYTFRLDGAASTAPMLFLRAKEN